tara:strand:- start:1764 stop:2036 length:273 start_codon:yes stop_codon:yes gene_type:complete
MSDTKSALAEFGGKLLLSIIIAIFIYAALVCFLFGASIGVNYFRDSNIFIKIIIFFVFGSFNLLTVLWYFIVKCKIQGHPIVPMDTPFPF